MDIFPSEIATINYVIHIINKKICNNTEKSVMGGSRYQDYLKVNITPPPPPQMAT